MAIRQYQQTDIPTLEGIFNGTVVPNYDERCSVVEQTIAKRKRCGLEFLSNYFRYALN